MMNPRQKKTPSEETLWVIGGGKFGQRAIQILRRAEPDSTIVLVDQQIVPGLQSDRDFVCSDGVEWLVEHLVPDSPVTKIIPTIPIHLAAEWLKRKILYTGGFIRSLEIPEKLLHQLPHPMRISPSKSVLSHADFICPDNCAEPDQLCSYTRKPRPPSLYHLIETIDCGDFTPIVVRSRQFAPGVGGFFPEDLWNLLARVNLLPDTPLLVGTACKCHGVVDAFCHGRAKTFL
jgi:hypothetical protein